MNIIVIKIKQNMSKNILEQVGLSNEQAKVYEFLIKNITLNARKISIGSGVNRSLVYKILKQLIELDLVVENKIKNGVNSFTALHPSNLDKIIKNKENELKIADSAFHEVISILGKDMNLATGKPSVRFYEGLDGLKMLYKDILICSKNIKLIRSPLDNKDKNLDKIVEGQIKNQVIKGIKTKAITPMNLEYSDFFKEKDKINLVERCRVPIGELNIPSQIIIYDKKVAFTSFKNPSITTIIEDPSISETMDTIFEHLWIKFK